MWRTRVFPPGRSPREKNPPPASRRRFSGTARPAFPAPRLPYLRRPWPAGHIGSRPARRPSAASGPAHSRAAAPRRRLRPAPRTQGRPRPKARRCPGKSCARSLQSVRPTPAPSCGDGFAADIRSRTGGPCAWLSLPAGAAGSVPVGAHGKIAALGLFFAQEGRRNKGAGGVQARAAALSGNSTSA